MPKKYVIRLEAEERTVLEGLMRGGRCSVRKLKRAQILLQADVSEAGLGWKDQQIAQGLGISVRSIENIRRQFIERGLDCLKPRERRYLKLRRKLDGEKEAKLIAVSCSSPPAGRARWTLRLLADRLVELAVVDSLSYETVRRTLQKTS
jgi:transposase